MDTEGGGGGRLKICGEFLCILWKNFGWNAITHQNQTWHNRKFGSGRGRPGMQRCSAHIGWHTEIDSAYIMISIDIKILMEENISINHDVFADGDVRMANSFSKNILYNFLN